MDSIASGRGAGRLIGASLVARLPMAMLPVGLLIRTQQLTGSFAQAGAVVGAFGIALGVGGPLLGRLVDRRGPTAVLLASGSICSALVITIALLPGHASLCVFVLFAAGAGLTEPPVESSLRAQLPALLSTPDSLRHAYTLEASLAELTYIAGPPLTLCLGAIWSGALALAVAGIGLLVGTALAAYPASRGRRPASVRVVARRGPLRTPAMRTLVAVLAAFGALLGAGEVAVIDAAKTLHSAVGSAPLFAVWGAGSFVGGLVLTRLGGAARSTTALALLLGALTAGHLALIPADGSVIALAVVLFLAGAAIAPTEATLYAMVDGATPGGSMTEAFAWLATAVAVGGAAGSAAAGFLADAAGPAAAFAFAGGAGGLALLIGLLRSRTLPLPRRAIRPTPRRLGQRRQAKPLPI